MKLRSPATETLAVAPKTMISASSRSLLRQMNPSKIALSRALVRAAADVKCRPNPALNLGNRILTRHAHPVTSSPPSGAPSLETTGLSPPVFWRFGLQ